jgi:hypothetical protein
MPQIECKKCKSKSINVGTSPVTSKGFTVYFDKCPICNYVFTDEDIEDFLNSFKNNKS